MLHATAVPVGEERLKGMYALASPSQSAESPPHPLLAQQPAVHVAQRVLPASDAALRRQRPLQAVPQLAAAHDAIHLAVQHIRCLTGGALQASEVEDMEQSTRG